LDTIEYEEEEFLYLRTMIYNYVKNDYPMDILVLNWRDIRKLGNNSSSLEAHILRYGNEIGEKKFKEKNDKCVFGKKEFIEKYGEEQANIILSSRGCSLENFINRYGIDEGNKKWNEYCTKRAASYASGKKEKKYASRNLEWFQHKHGTDKGYEIWDKKRKSQAYKVSLEWYIETYGEEQGRIECKKAKTRTLESFINKYGTDDGLARYSNWIQKITANSNITFYSKWSVECCENIKQHISDLYYYGKNEMCWNLPLEYANKLNKKSIKPDLFYKGKVIEFHGDIFHGNPIMFHADSTPIPYKKHSDVTAADIWKKDSIRKQYYESKGYTVLEVWEHEYKTNKTEVIEKCLTFLK
jgi:hypothetical protein